MDWGHDGAEFIGQMEYNIINRFLFDIDTWKNPFFLIAILGQLLILIGIFASENQRRLATLGVLLLNIIALLAFILAVMRITVESYNAFISMIPFIIFTIFHFYKKYEPKRKIELSRRKAPAS
jgi:hypothetical protein